MKATGVTALGCRLLASTGLLLSAMGVMTFCGYPDHRPSDCSVFAAQEVSPYVLPYQVGRSFKVEKTTVTEARSTTQSILACQPALRLSQAEADRS